MRLLLISVKSEKSLGGMAVWTDRFLAKSQRLGITCSLVNTDLLESRMKTGKRQLTEEVVRTCRMFRQLKSLLNTEEYDAAYLNTSCGSYGLFRDYWMARMIRKKGIPLVTHYHCEIPYWVRKKASIRCLGRLAAQSRQNLVLCENSKKYLQDRYGIESEKVPNFVAQSMVLLQEKEIRPTVETIAFVGRVSETKGAAELFEIARRLPDIRFLLIGEVSEQVRTWEKPANVELPGTMPNEQVIACLDAVDLFLFPSHTEGCSMALMEAMARGLPCIATDVGANADMLRDGCGVIVPKRDVTAMVAAIRELEDPDRRRELSARTVERVRQDYTDRNVDKILALIGQL